MGMYNAGKGESRKRDGQRWDDGRKGDDDYISRKVSLEWVDSFRMWLLSAHHLLKVILIPSNLLLCIVYTLPNKTALTQQHMHIVLSVVSSKVHSRRVNQLEITRGCVQEKNFLILVQLQQENLPNEANRMDDDDDKEIFILSVVGQEMNWKETRRIMHLYFSPTFSISFHSTWSMLIKTSIKLVRCASSYLDALPCLLLQLGLERDGWWVGVKYKWRMIRQKVFSFNSAYCS